MKKNKAFYFVQTALIVFLLGAIGILINQNNNIKSENRKLLLQNDSIQSVNLILSNTVDTIIKKNNRSFFNSRLTVR
jgi:hypothetical protein